MYRRNSAIILNLSKIEWARWKSFNIFNSNQVYHCGKDTEHFFITIAIVQKWCDGDIKGFNYSTGT